MARYNTFTFRVNKEEKQIIEALSNKLKRTRSDAVRWVIREAAQALTEEGFETAVSPQNPK
ncbi:MAG: hypothetical protein KC449_09625 [Anaerolineales bacterium]|nr:hypothetical protein [Anaerolineales bacterium]